MSGDGTGQIRRKNVRYKADPAHCAQISFELAPADFKCDISALIVDESYRGCCLVAFKADKFTVGARFRIRLGPLTPLIAEVRWIDEIDETLIRLGFLFP